MQNQTNLPVPIQLIECPRDAMQGWKQIISTDRKIEYINNLLQVGFHTIDFGSFVSAKAIPQMADTKDVLEGIQLNGSSSKLLAIVANVRGAAEAAQYEKIAFLGFPFSVSETFQHRNANSSIAEALARAADIQKICTESGKQFVIYISMGFGNPYGDPYSKEMVYEWTRKIVDLGITIISLADTVGLATPDEVLEVSGHVVNHFPSQTIGVHLHSAPQTWKAKLDAALEAGVSRIDGALKGIGGCPMANDELVGNLDTELMIPYLEEKNLIPELNHTALKKSQQLASEIFL